MTTWKWAAGVLMCLGPVACNTGEHRHVELGPVAKLPPGPVRPADAAVENTAVTLGGDGQRATFRWGPDAAAGSPAAWTGPKVLRGDAARREIGARAEMAKSTETVAGGGTLTMTFTDADGCAGRVRTGEGKEPEFEFRPAG